MSILYHCPKGVGRKHSRAFWSYANALLDNAPVQQAPDNVAFITYNNGDGQLLMERFYQKHSIKAAHVVAQGWRPWTWYAKILPVLELLNSGAIAQEYVCVTDGRDVAVGGLLTDLEHMFKVSECDMLLSGTCANWPPHIGARDFETARYGITGRQHLSAGGYFGRTDYIRESLSKVVNAVNARERWSVYCGGFDDQHAWRMLHMAEFPRMQVDAQGHIFKRYDYAL